MNIKEKYILETEKYRSPEQGEGTWSQLKCKVMEVSEDGSKKQIGEYIRSYTCLYNTWLPFVQNGQEYALCSPKYTGTSVMKLPECEIIAQEPNHSWGFCPTGYFVPQIGDKKKGKEDFEDEEYDRCRFEDLTKEGTIGFVCGCVWGDDNGWKIQCLDLSKIEEGILNRDERFGYTILEGGSEDLEKAIDWFYVTDYFWEVHIKGEREYYYPLNLHHKLKSLDQMSEELSKRISSYTEMTLSGLKWNNTVDYDRDELQKKLIETTRSVIRNYLIEHSYGKE